LSPRELEVLRVAASGSTHKEIARDLDISPRTVQVHLANIFSKLKAGSRTEAVLVGIRRGWINPNDLGGE
ncbi:MAG: response regulator transcription factor, partial [Deinococcus sp.]